MRLILFLLGNWHYFQLSDGTDATSECYKSALKHLNQIYSVAYATKFFISAASQC